MLKNSFDYQRFRFWVLTLLFLAVISYSCRLEAQTTSGFRRHFILVYDIGIDNQTDDYIKNTLVTLFSSGDFPSHGIGTLIQFNQELTKKNMFFDPSRDEISCYQSGVSRNGFSDIQRTMDPDIKSNEKLFGTFTDKYIRTLNIVWSSTPVQGNSLNDRVSAFFRQFWESKPKSGYYNNGISTPELVYPLIISRLPANSYAETYVLIVISHNIYTNNLNNLFSFPRNGQAARNMIVADKDSLAAKLTILPGFDYRFNTNTTVSPGNSLGIRAMIIRPKPSGYPEAGNQTFTLFQEFSMTQGFWNPADFTFSGNFIQASKYKQYTCEGAKLALYRKGHLLTEQPLQIVNDPVAPGNIEVTGFTCSIDSLAGYHTFPDLDGQVSLYSKYHLNTTTSLNCLHGIETVVREKNIIGSYSKKRNMEIAIGIGILILLVGLFLIGKPIGIDFDFQPINDSYESSDMSGEGRMNRPYLAWTQENTRKNEYPAQVDVKVIYLFQDYWFNWSTNVRVTLDKVDMPVNYKVLIKAAPGAVRDFETTFDLKYNPREDSNCFTYLIRQSGAFSTPASIIKTRIIGSVKISTWNFGQHKKDNPFDKKIDFKFYIGPDLGDYWTGIDPGTTGTCIAMGRLASDIIVEKKNKKDYIYPSRISFNINANIHSNIDSVIKFDEFAKGDPAIYLVGDRAIILHRNAPQTFRSYESIKNLLGFQNKIKIYFPSSNQTLEFSGTDLTYLMVNGFLKSFKNYLSTNNSIPSIADMLSHDEIKSKRVVVTIPNNFTLRKTHDLIRAINMGGQFKEIRYIYEAEAAFFYYLSQPNSFKKNVSENVLIFDMGGATINVTALEYNNTEKHNIKILSKKGYSIGGDSIDYFLKEHLFYPDRKKDYTPISALMDVPENFDNRIVYLSEFHAGIQSLKHTLSDNFQYDKEHLIDDSDLANTFYAFIDASKKSPKEKEELKEFFSGKPVDSTKIEESTKNTKNKKLDETKFYKDFSLKDGQYGFLDVKNNPFIARFYQDNLFSFIKDLLTDVLSESKLISNQRDFAFNKIIIAGRSTQFPYIKQTVLEQLNFKASTENLTHYTGSELKTAVARGACWYGINRNTIHLDNYATNACFGIIETVEPNNKTKVFHTIIPPGTRYSFQDHEAPKLQKEKPVESNFAFDDGNLVNFYMAMGSDPLHDIEHSKKEKIQKLCDIHPVTAIKITGMEVSVTDKVKCYVVTKNNITVEKDPLIQDLEVKSSNNQHYTFWSVVD